MEGSDANFNTLFVNNLFNLNEKATFKFLFNDRRK